MNAKQLLLEDGTRLRMFACGKCGTLHDHSPIGTTDGERWDDTRQLQWMKDRAERCCQEKCDDCAAPLDGSQRHQSYCRDCQSKRWREREAKQEAESFLKATAVSGDDVKLWWNDRVYDDIDEVIERYECDDEEPPAYVWVAEPIPFTVDADHVIENALDDHHEEAGECISDVARKELQDLLDKWCAEQDVNSYTPSRRHYVLISEKANEPQS
jgi:hypothetical protein